MVNRECILLIVTVQSEEEEEELDRSPRDQLSRIQEQGLCGRSLCSCQGFSLSYRKGKGRHMTLAEVCLNSTH